MLLKQKKKERRKILEKFNGKFVATTFYDIHSHSMSHAGQDSMHQMKFAAAIANSLRSVIVPC